jgi:hypothetical protein
VDKTFVLACSTAGAPLVDFAEFDVLRLIGVHDVMEGGNAHRPSLDHALHDLLLFLRTFPKVFLQSVRVMV